MATSDLSALARATAAGASQSETSSAGVPVPRRRWKTRVLLPVAVGLGTLGLFAYAAGDLLQPAQPVRVTPVLAKTDVQAVAAGAVVVQAPGWVEADPFPTAVSALADGVVEEVLVLEGQRVEAGEVVVRLVSEDAELALQRVVGELGQRKADLEVARAVLAEAQQDWDNPIELTRRLETAEAQLAEKRAALKRWPAELEREKAHALYLEAEYERLKPLHAEGQASDIELVKARQAHAAQQAEVEATRLREPILAAQVRTLEAEVQAAREDLRLRIPDTRRLAEARAAVTRAEAALAESRARRAEAALRVERMEVRSPVSGIAMNRIVEPGSKVMLQADNPQSAYVVRLYDPECLQVRVDVPLVDAAKVGVGQQAEVIVDVLPDRVFAGEVTRVVHEADIQKNTLQVKVAIKDPVSDLKPEMLARARFLASPKEHEADVRRAGQRLFVPRDALVDSDGQPQLWLADQVDNVARRITVATGPATVDDWIEITEGVRVGDRVILDAPQSLTDGQRIRIRQTEQ